MRSLYLALGVRTCLLLLVVLCCILNFQHVSATLPATTFNIPTPAFLSTTTYIPTARVPTCINSCSSHGQCSSNNTCICDQGWLDVDCSLQSLMTPICRSLGYTQYCAYWRIQDGSIYQRINATMGETGVGFIGYMWGADLDGMTNGTGVRISMGNTYYPVVQDILAFAKSRPRDVTNSIAQIDVIGFIANSTENSNKTMDVSFRRALNTTMADHIVLPSTPGFETRLSWAWYPTTFGFHHNQAYTFSLDLVATSSGNSSSGNETCPYNCTGNGQCLPNGMCMCDEDWLGSSCNIPSPMSPMCFTKSSSNTMCMRWSIQEGIAYFRVTTTFTGWAGLLFNFSNVMQGGQAIWMQPTSSPYVTELYSYQPDSAPTPITSMIEDISSYVTPAGKQEYTFKRVCNTKLAQHVVFPTQAGDLMLMGYAFNPDSSSLSFHNQNFGFFYVDMITANITEINFSVAELYIPVIVAALVIIVVSLLFRFRVVYQSKLGEFLLRKRLQSLREGSISIVHASDGRGNYPGATNSNSNWSLLNTLSNDALFTLRDMTFGELTIVLFYAISIIIMCTIGRNLLTDAMRDPNLIFAHVSAFHLALTILPVTRNSLWLHIFGISFERAIKYHRMVARATLGFILGHGINRVQVHGKDILFDTEMLQNGEGAIYGSLCALCIILMAATAFGAVRRIMFESFIYAHIPLFISTVVFACLHSLYVRYYLIVPLILYGLDHVARFVSSARPAAIVAMHVYQDEVSTQRGFGAGARVTELVIRVTNFKYTPGQYVFINFPKLSPLQWHPFSISDVSSENRPASHFVDASNSADDNLLRRRDLIALHILDAGKGTWTHELSQLVTQCMHSHADQQDIQMESSDHLLAHNSPAIYVDGPYGSLSIPLFEYKSVALLAGGIGITPFASILYDILNRIEYGASIGSVTVVWTSRHLYYFSELYPALLSRMAEHTNCQLFLYCTSTVTSLPVSSTGKFLVDTPNVQDATIVRLALPNSKDIPINISRPNLASILQKAGENYPPSSVGVLTCGPSSLVEDAQKYSMNFGYHLHKETFLL